MNNNYIPLYRKYRPQSLEQVVGQEHIKKALTNAINTDRIAHAYLFTGPRGTGKTSTARIFAKSLNCKNGPTVSPCNECENCLNITKSVPIDVIEMDAASNRSVNDAEEIIQNVAMAPINSRYKIYIIDEVHMLTPTAFNALLKTLEEPPKNVIFILATTEVHKVLDTIKSRCQRFDFKRITTDDIVKHLRYISDCEKINITDEALKYIAVNSAGGMRDSIALLDQLSVLSSDDKEISTDDINRLLGRLSFNDLSDLFKYISESDGTKALDILNHIYNLGNEPSQILSNFLEYLRNALIIKSLSDDEGQNVVQLNKEQIKLLQEQLKNIDTHQIVSLIDKCAGYIKELKLTSNPKLWLDVSILDMANLVQNTKIEELQKRLANLEAGNTLPTQNYNTPPMPVNKLESKSKTFTQTVSKPVQNHLAEEKTVTVAAASKVQTSVSSSDLKNNWEKFLENISSFPSRAILKQQAIPLKVSSDEIIITIKNQTWLKSFSNEGERYPFLEESAKKTFGDGVKLVVRFPQSGDEKIRSEQSKISLDSADKSKDTEPKAPLIPPSVKQDKELKEVTEDQTLIKENQIETEPQQHKYQENKSEDAGYHNENYNMVMDLFEGKVIE